MRREDAPAVVGRVRLDDHRRAAVAEEDRHVPARVREVEVVRLDFGGADQDLLVRAGSDVLVGDG